MLVALVAPPNSATEHELAHLCDMQRFASLDELVADLDAFDGVVVSRCAARSVLTLRGLRFAAPCLPLVVVADAVRTLAGEDAVEVAIPGHVADAVRGFAPAELGDDADDFVTTTPTFVDLTPPTTNVFGVVAPPPDTPVLQPDLMPSPEPAVLGEVDDWLVDDPPDTPAGGEAEPRAPVPVPQQPPPVLLRPPVAATGPLVVMVYSSKGGVGKTTVSTNLAGILAGAGKNVVILDLDIEDSNVGSRLGIHRPTVMPLFTDPSATLNAQTVGQFLAYAPADRIYAAVVPQIGRGERSDHIITPHAYRERVFAPCEKLFDAIILDTPANPHAPLVAQFALDVAGVLLIVVDGERATIIGAHGQINEFTTLRHFPIENIGLVVNMDVSKRGGLSESEIRDNLFDLPILAKLRDDRASAVSAANRGSLLVSQVSELGQLAREQFAALAKTLCPEIEIDTSSVEGRKVNTTKRSGLFAAVRGVFGR